MIKVEKKPDITALAIFIPGRRKYLAKTALAAKAHRTSGCKNQNILRISFLVKWHTFMINNKMK